MCRCDCCTCSCVSCKASPEQKLLEVLDQIDVLFDSEQEWHAKYHHIFDLFDSKVEPLMEKLGMTFSYSDPDTTYQEDVTALVTALRNIRSFIST